MCFTQSDGYCHLAFFVSYLKLKKLFKNGDRKITRHMVVTLTSGNYALSWFGESSSCIQFGNVWCTVVHWMHYYRPYLGIFSKLWGYFHKQEFGRLDIQSRSTYFEFVVIYVLFTVSGTIGNFSSAWSNKGKQIYLLEKITACNKILLSLL